MEDSFTRCLTRVSTWRHRNLRRLLSAPLIRLRSSMRRLSHLDAHLTPCYEHPLNRKRSYYGIGDRVWLLCWCFLSATVRALVSGLFRGHFVIKGEPAFFGYSFERVAINRVVDPAASITDYGMGVSSCLPCRRIFLSLTTGGDCFLGG